MYTYVLADYMAYSGENEINILKGRNIISALMDYCEENDIYFSYGPCDTLSTRLDEIRCQTNHRINIIQLN